MVKIRVRVPGGETHKIEIATSATFAELKAIAGQRLRSSDKLNLSLNKQVTGSHKSSSCGNFDKDVQVSNIFFGAEKTPLEVADEDTLSAIGICSGDLLWVLRSSSSVQQTAGPSPASTLIPSPAAANKSGGHMLDTSSSTRNSAEPLVRCTLPVDVHVPDAVDQTGPCSLSGSCDGFPEMLDRILHAAWNTANVPSTPIAAVHAAMLNRNFQPAWSRKVFLCTSSNWIISYRKLA